MIVFGLDDIFILALGAIGIAMLLGCLVASGIKALINKAEQAERGE